MYSLPLTSQTRGPLPRAMMVSIAMMLPVLPPGRTRAARSKKLPLALAYVVTRHECLHWCAVGVACTIPHSRYGVERRRP